MSVGGRFLWCLVVKSWAAALRRMVAQHVAHCANSHHPAFPCTAVPVRRGQCSRRVSRCGSRRSRCLPAGGRCHAGLPSGHSCLPHLHRAPPGGQARAECAPGCSGMRAAWLGWRLGC